MKKILTTGLSLLIAATWGCVNASAPSDAPAVPVRVVEAQHEQVGNTLQYSATIVPCDQVNPAFQSGGYVGSIRRVRGADGLIRLVDVGDFVRAGTVPCSACDKR